MPKAKAAQLFMCHLPQASQVRKNAKLAQAQMAPLIGMNVSGYRKREQGKRNISGPAAASRKIIEKEPDVVRRFFGVEWMRVKKYAPSVDFKV